MDEQKYYYDQDINYFEVNLDAIDKDEFAADSYRTGFLNGVESILDKVIYDADNVLVCGVISTIVDDLRLDRCSVEIFRQRFYQDLISAIEKGYQVRRGPSKGSGWASLENVSGLSFHPDNKGSN